MSSPIIFEKGTRDFSTLGLGLLSDAIQATTTEELNGQFIFEMDYPVSGNNADLIKENRIIVVNSGHILKRQGFIIRQIVRKIDLTMTVYAEHVSYATLDVALAPVGTISGDAKTALENWKRMLVPTVDFTVDSDILTTNSTSIGAPEFETARQGLGGHAGSILDVWGGEYQFDNWHIRLLKQRGKSANAIIAYGRNLISFEQDTNIADTYTSVYPYYQENSGDDGNKTHFLPERTVDSEFVGKYPNPKVLMLDLSNKFKDVADYSETKLRNYALSYIQSNSIGVPKVNMKISTVDLSRATGGFSEDIDLGDTVNVYFEKLGITTSAKVIKTVWNVLSDDYDKFEIGARRSSLTESISELATTADENANKALNQAVVAQQSADGKTTIYYLDSSDPWPTNPKENDAAFVKDGENSIMYRYMFNNDTGMFSWVKILDSMSADQIKQRVSDALESGKAYSDKLVADNVAQVNRTLSDVQAKQADLTAQQAELDTKAQGYANKALADAKANTLATATQTAKDASDALAKAKTDLTTSLNKEVTDRANAVTALDTKAKGYAETAKNDAISASTTALNTAKTNLTTSITKEVTDRQKAITDLDAKSTGAINQAKTDAQSALDALQVGGRNLVIKDKLVTGWMGDGVVSSSTSAHAMTTDFVAVAPNSSLVAQIWYDNTKFDVTNNYLRVAFYDSNKTYITRTPLAGTGSTTYNKWLITTPANTAFVRMSFDWLGDGYGHAKLEIGNKATDYTQAPEDIVLDYTTKDNVISQSLTQYQATNDGKVTKAQSDATQALGLVATKVSQTDYNTKTGDLDSKYTAVKQTADQASTDIVAIKSTNTSQDTKINTLISDVSGTKQSISDIQTEQGKQSTKINTIQTDVSGTKQDISDIKDANGVQDGKIASISTTVDGLSSSFSTYKTTNDGKVAKAQADITANATAISQKVSQTAYDAKTGQLQTDLTAVTTTANGNKTEIVAIKKTDTDQDARMTTIESDANGVKTTVSSLQTTANTQAGSISTLQQRADGFEATVATLGQINQLFNTEFSPDLQGWKTVRDPFVLSGSYKGSNQLLNTATTSGNRLYADLIYVKDVPAISFSVVNDSWVVVRGYGQDRKLLRELYSQSRTGYGLNKMENKAIPSDVYYVEFGFQSSAGGYVSQPMLTFSDKVGKYVQGNYNNNASVAKAQLTADNASLSLSNYKTDADGRISKAQADIIVNANAITQKVSQSDYNAKTGDLTTKVNTAQSTADSATSTIGSYKQTNDARVASAESKITANATAITSKVSQSDYNTKTGQIDGQISTINQTAGKISQTVSDVKAQVDGLSVGGRNLFVLATASKGWLDLSYNVTAPGDASLASDFIPVTANNTYVAQQWYIMSHPSGGGYLRYAFYDSTKTPISRVPAPASNSATYSKWVIITPANASFIRMSFDYTANNWSNVKFEQGNMPTDWSPAPEDIDNKISTVSQTVDSISSIVSDPTTGLTRRIQTAEGSISTVQSNVSDLQSKQTQTANGLTTEISNRATGDTNTLTQAKDFTTSSISNSESGMRSLITQTSDSIIAKVDTKTDSATVLSLLKDNWSIGITGNTNKLASGIAADPSAMAIVSQKVIIDSPQTQITGTAWINSAMIGTGQIGTAQIGDAAITNAKIANLDVSKITGNVTNFIQSNWNGVYESTTITNNGMQIVTSDITTTFGPRGIKLTQGGESVGGIGVSSYVDMPTNFQGIAFNLDGTGDYMTWSARESGVTTGDYTTKLAWFRSSYKPIGQNAGFNFSPDSPVTFWGDIYGRDNTEPIKIDSFGMHGVSAGGIGHGNGSSAITFGGDSEIYIVSGGHYYKLAQLVKALQPLIGLGTWSIPKNINSSGVVTQWTNITT